MASSRWTRPSIPASRRCHELVPAGYVAHLSYQGYLIARLFPGGALEPANEDDLYINAAILELLAA